MLRKPLSLTLVLLMAIFSLSVKGQYPQLTKEEQEAELAYKQKNNEISDKAWEKALPIVMEEARNGRSYIPWAGRPEDLPQAKIPSFPGAEGGGMYTFGGRGGKVLVVTSLEDSGPGTFREACETGGARIIVFNVSGIIRLKTPLSIRAPYVTIAGQTAPGDGVCIAGETIEINTHDVIIRHMRFRRGETWVCNRDDAIGGNPVGNIMIDHVSASWGLDENMTLYKHMFTDAPNPDAPKHKYSTVNITIQNSMFTEGLDTYNHALGSTIGGQNCMFARNLWANNTGRNPSVGMNGGFNMVNNVIHNWYKRTTDGGGYSSRYQLINNYYKPGPVTPQKKPVGHRLIKPDTRYELYGTKIYGKVWVEGNIMEGYPEITNDNWKGIQIEDDMDGAGEYLAQIRSSKRFIMPYVTIMGAEEAYEYVLDNVGATLPKRDPVDIRLVKQVRSGKIDKSDYTKIKDLSQEDRYYLGANSWKKGIISDIRQVGGYPEYKGEPRIDSDMDGMPDMWEKKFGLNPEDASDANGDINGDGYTNIEKYINGIDPTQKVDWTDLKNNKDALAEKGGVMVE